MRRRILYYFSILIVTVTAIMGAAAYSVSRSNYENELRSTLYEQIDLFQAQSGVLQEKMAQFTKAFRGLRITVITADGTVLADSEISNSENHYDRPEIREAFATGSGSAKRYSASLHKMYFYTAKQAVMEGEAAVVRFSLPMDYLQQIDRNLAFYLLAATIGAIGIALCLSWMFAKKIVVPLRDLSDYARDISQGKFERKFTYRGKGEIAKLSQSVKLMHHRLERTIHALELKNIQLQTILDNTAGGIIALDRDNVILLINKTALRMLAIPKQDTVGKDFFAVYQSDELKRFLSNDRSEASELLFGDKTYHVTISDMLHEDGTSDGRIIMLQDISEMKRLMNLRSEFASNVSHELKTPLTSIKGFIDTLKNGAMDNPKAAARFLEIIDIETDRLTSLINDILEISNLENGKAEERAAVCDLDSLAAEVCELVEHQAQKKQITVTACNETGGALVAIDRDRMKQVLLNLVSNGIRYNKDGGRVEVFFRWETDELVIAVRDTGIGIREEDQERIFERFYRVDKGRSRESGGTGLGLSIVKHIAQMYGGSVSVVSKADQGSEFTVRLPANRIEK